MFRGSYTIDISKTDLLGCSEEVTLYIFQNKLMACSENVTLYIS